MIIYTSKFFDTTNNNIITKACQPTLGNRSVLYDVYMILVAIHACPEAGFNYFRAGA